MFTRTENFRQYLSYYPLVSTLITFTIFLFFLDLLPILPEGILFEKGQGVNLYIASGEWWRLVTPIFLHSSFSHLLFNCFALAIFGPPLERLLGSLKFTVFFLITGILANIITFILQPPTYIHVGASGAIFGLLGFYLYLVLFKKTHLPKQEVKTIYTLIGVGVLMTFIQPKINITGHLSGLAAGLLLASLFIQNRRKR
ncbi:rhomboid family intramembrane serine protease [Peribacillus loiseleuriae]|uniref:Membrane protein n=1 Tax=Peribacillus loiseleuriae TaxID=1679170 RepID=A0A0K9GP04_9BACI|nr:rhomboid family intramembrane serine protease [Peribacillus loiseleuriae]KMY48326.1 membrane protein [Peribacillus loiseleuriae]